MPVQDSIAIHPIDQRGMTTWNWLKGRINFCAVALLATSSAQVCSMPLSVHHPEAVEQSASLIVTADVSNFTGRSLREATDGNALWSRQPTVVDGQRAFGPAFRTQVDMLSDLHDVQTHWVSAAFDANAERRLATFVGDGEPEAAIEQMRHANREQRPQPSVFALLLYHSCVGDECRGESEQRGEKRQIVHHRGSRPFDDGTSAGERLAIRFLVIALAGATLGASLAVLRLATTHRVRLTAVVVAALALASIGALAAS